MIDVDYCTHSFILSMYCRRDEYCTEKFKHENSCRCEKFLFYIYQQWNQATGLTATQKSAIKIYFLLQIASFYSILIPPSCHDHRNIEAQHKG